LRAYKGLVMFILVGIAGTIAVWFWLFPPEHISERARSVMIACSLTVALLSLGISMALMNAAEGSRRRARDQYRESERQKQEMIRRIEEEQRGLGAAPAGR
jgi:hypothetical protein